MMSIILGDGYIVNKYDANYFEGFRGMNKNIEIVTYKI